MESKPKESLGIYVGMQCDVYAYCNKVLSYRFFGGRSLLVYHLLLTKSVSMGRVRQLKASLTSLIVL